MGWGWPEFVDTRVRGPSHLKADLLDVSGDRHRVDALEPELPVLAPVKELFDRPRVGPARIAVPDVGRKEFDKPPLSALVLGADSGRQHIHAKPHQRRWRWDFVGQQYRRFPA
jgi:hypothetical protein